ncbi:MAG: hypothetical protein HC810_05955, partial [Acaryochloridaceae cyanobacterium RL_2_7]|nr:hypothetical protein [Acaryochloridaceae cyanobacterium RL_2_7]
MTVQVQTLKTGRFRDWSKTFAWGSFVVVLGAMVGSLFLERNLISKRFSVTEDAAARSDLIQYRPSAIGALRVDAKAVLPANYWVTYEVQILDQNDKVLTSGLKQAWRETGSWYEDGESGSWDESDLDAGFALKLNEKETQTLRVAIQVLESGETSGREWAGPVTFELDVHDGSIDMRYLWLGFGGTLVMAYLTGLIASGSGKKVISKVIQDSDVGDRAVMGGQNKLIEVQVFINSDENTPKNLTVELSIRNPDGVTVHEKRTTVAVRLIYDDGTVDAGKASYKDYFLLSPQGLLWVL